MTMFLLCIPLLVGLLLVPALGWADYPAGEDAYNHGDYATALNEWRSLAAQGDAGGQNGLGLMYVKGQGVFQDSGEAAKWFHLAADQRYAVAQYNLGRYCQLKANSDQSTGGAGSLISDKSMDFGQVNYLFSG